MVSKSYEVNECPKIADDDDECVKNVKMQNSEQMKRIDRYMLHITNEMVSDKIKKAKTKIIRSQNGERWHKGGFALRHSH